MNSVLQSSGCYQRVGSDVYSAETLEKCVYIYGKSLMLILNSINVTVSNANVLGWLFIVLVSLLLGKISSDTIIFQDRPLALFSAFLFLSPPVMLLLERGNFDVLMLGLVYLGAFAYSKNLRLLALVLVCFAALIKFYTLPLAFLLIFSLKGIRSVIIGLVCNLCTTFLVLTDLQKIEHTFPGYLSGSFGNQLLGLYLQTFDLNLTRIERDFFGIIVLLIILFSLYKIDFVKKALPVVTCGNEKSSNLILNVEIFFILVFISCYFGSVNYGYRLIFLLIATFLEIIRLTTLKRSILSLSVLLIVVAWFSLNFIYLQVISNLSILILIAYFVKLMMAMLASNSMYLNFRHQFNPYYSKFLKKPFVHE